MEFQKLEVKARNVTGKGRSRKIRKAGRVPGIVYGRGIEPMMIDLEPRDLRMAFQGPHRRNTVLSLVVNDGGSAPKEMLVMLQDHQIHPRDRTLMHVDFLKVDLDRDVEVDVPLVTTGRCQGVQMGGILLQVYHELPVKCRPDDIPIRIEHDITALGIGHSVKASELPFPPGVTVMLDAEQAVLAVTAPEAEEEKPVEEAEEAEEVEGEERKEEEGEKPAKAEEDDKQDRKK